MDKRKDIMNLTLSAMGRIDYSISVVTFSVVNTDCYGGQLKLSAVNQRFYLWKTNTTFFRLVTQSFGIEFLVTKSFLLDLRF